MTLTRRQQIEALEKDWATNPRWNNVKRTYTAEEVVELRGSVTPANTIAQRGADKLWSLVNGSSKKGYVNCLGALTGGQAVQQAKAGIEAIYLSGWQVAADNNTASTMYPDQSLYPVDSVPSVVKRINNSFRRADQIQWAGGKSPEDEGGIDYFLPIVADAEAGFGGVLNAYELMKNMIESGAAGVHFEDQLASVKKCGHMGGKVLVPTQEAVQKLVAARLAADVSGTTTLVIARTDANAADLLTSDCDPYDRDFIQGERTAEGFYRVKAGIDQAISRGLAYAPYADLIWCETAKPCLEEARKFAEAVHAEYPDQLLAYNCSPSFNWEKNLDSETIAKFQQELADMGYKYQFITLAGIHNMWFNMFELAHAYAQGEGMRHYVEKVQRPEFEAADKGYTFVAHQQEVGTGYFDRMTNTIQGGNSSVTALTGSTEEEQF
ncbi:isocitrate lyase [Vibrio clamense]|uniref:isocitrate lyase n=1 Tax=Vibrio TaxID=662 RepID=UPI000DE8E1A8|nr:MULTISPECIES: isocitrate lyase [Vibrio]MDN3696476.1 isocitrate lyase [Vibrio cortegadensis]NOH84725.1 isocitrate lyase [Vibrio sp. 03-59-1]RBW66099.1 isocitrate lyase [Vibrionales bacterium C3R12]